MNGRVIQNKKLYSLLEKAGVEDVILVKGDGYFYLDSYDDEVYHRVISNIESNFIPLWSFSSITEEEWVLEIKSILNNI